MIVQPNDTMMGSYLGTDYMYHATIRRACLELVTNGGTCAPVMDEA